MRPVRNFYMGFYQCQLGELGFFSEGTRNRVKAFDPGNGYLQSCIQSRYKKMGMSEGKLDARELVRDDVLRV